MNRFSLKKIIFHPAAMICIVGWLMTGFSVTLRAQRVDDLEKQYYYLTLSAESSAAAQDSIRKNIDAILTQIRSEKEKTYANQDLIRSHMADIVDLRKQLKSSQKESQILQNKLLTLRGQLQDAYQQVIDSLTLQKDKTSDPVLQDNIDKTVAFFLEKRLILAPVIHPLTFSWADIEKTELTNVTDSLELQIRKEYISLALQEIDDRIGAIKSARKKYDDMISFHQKLETFTQDIDIPFFTGNNSRLERYETGNNTTFNDVSSGVWKSNIQSLNIVFLQLNVDPNIIKKIKSGHSENDISYDEFIKLIELAEKSLKQYRTIIQQKLSKMK